MCCALVPDRTRLNPLVNGTAGAPLSEYAPLPYCVAVITTCPAELHLSETLWPGPMVCGLPQATMARAIAMTRRAVRPLVVFTAAASQPGFLVLRTRVIRSS